MRRARPAALAAGAALLLLLGAAAARESGRVVLLAREHGAPWLRPDEPFWLGSRSPGPREALFRRALRGQGPGELRLETLGEARVEVAPDARQVLVRVRNVDGPALLRDGSGGAGWEAGRDGTSWLPAVPADAFRPDPLSLRFGSPGRALLRLLPLYLLLFGLAFWGAWSLGGRRLPAGSASRARWALLAAWAVLVVNDLPKLPLELGFDVGAHLDYMQYLVSRGRLPMATEGWQMFQAPLYYLVSAPLYLAANALHAHERVGRVLLRLLPALCGAAQLELAYRATRSLFEDREDLQILGTLVGGLLPMNVYMSLEVGNEPLCAALSAAAIVRALTPGKGRKRALTAGLLLGAACLTKASALLLVAPVALLLGAEDGPLAAGAALAVCGWWYALNWLRLGAPFLGGWSALRGIEWWQDPGYRTARELLRFGEALRHPVYAGLAGLWDSWWSTAWLDGFLSSMIAFEARPPWNYSFLLAQSWLSLLPAAALFAGAAAALRPARRAERARWAFVLACVALYAAAAFWLWLTHPMYGMGKATYALGLLPCFAALGALGFERLTRGRAARAAVFGVMACWAASSFLGYFVR